MTRLEDLTKFLTDKGFTPGTRGNRDVLQKGQQFFYIEMLELMASGDQPLDSLKAAMDEALAVPIPKVIPPDLAALQKQMEEQKVTNLPLK